MMTAHSLSKLISSGYFDKIIRYCNDMAIGEEQKLDKNSPNYARFVEAVKMVMDWRLDHLQGFDLCFNADYTILRKNELFIRNC